MMEIRFHGRGGQGAVTAARLLAQAAFYEGKYSQSFPFFGAERRGAPVLAFARINDRPIGIRTQIYEPDCVVVLDPSLLKFVNVASGIKRDGKIVLNAKEPVKFPGASTYIVDATGVAMETLGAPITNTAMLGAFARAAGAVGLESVIRAIQEYFPSKLVEKNVNAVKVAYERTRLVE
ncbi:MAG: pyruvate ferredoxin oxidoreductase subunit gamma [Candidatus Hadarchaeales archaeon]